MNRLQKPVPTVITIFNLKRCNLTQQLEVIKKLNVVSLFTTGFLKLLVWQVKFLLLFLGR